MGLKFSPQNILSLSPRARGPAPSEPPPPVGGPRTRREVDKASGFGGGARRSWRGVIAGEDGTPTGRARHVARSGARAWAHVAARVSPAKATWYFGAGSRGATRPGGKTRGRPGGRAGVALMRGCARRAPHPCLNEPYHSTRRNFFKKEFFFFFFFKLSLRNTHGVFAPTFRP